MNKSSSKLQLIVFLFLFFAAHTQVAFANGKVVKEGIERIVRSGADDASKIATRKIAIETAEKSATRQIEKIAATRASKATEPVIQPIKQSVKPASPAPKTLNGSSSQQVDNLATSPQNVVRPQKTVDIRTIRPRTPNNQADNLTTEHLKPNYGANSAVNRVRLEKQLASQEQVSQLTNGRGVVISQPAKQADRIATQNSRNSTNIQKVSSEARVTTDGQKIETHAYRDATDNKLFETKTIIKDK